LCHVQETTKPPDRHNWYNKKENTNHPIRRCPKTMKKVEKDFIRILPPKEERSKMFKTVLEEKGEER
jgi:hypothetical protein